MTGEAFREYIDILEEKPFLLYPPPRGPDQRVDWSLKKFKFVDHSAIHVTIKDVESERVYDLPLVLVEFANVGVLRLTREVAPWNGSFV